MPLLLIIAFLLRLPAVFQSHNETDEQIYLTLAQQVWERGLAGYTLRGSPILKELPQDIYDKPVFHHPPVYILVLAPWVRVGGVAGAVLFSVLCGVALVAATYFLARRRYGTERAVLAAAVIALCPIAAFVSGRVWLDTPAALTTALGLLVWQWALARGGAGRYAMAGLAAALSAMLKFTNLLAAPAYGVLGLEALSRGWPRERRIGLVVFFTTGIMLALPWFIWFKLATGHLVAHWTRPTPLAREMYPFAKMVAERKAYYYFLMVPLIAPFYILSFRGMIQAVQRERDWLPVLWALSFLVGLSIFGAAGYTFQMRYTTPALPGLALAVAAVEPWTRARKIQFALFGGLGLMTLAFNAWILAGDDVFPLPSLLMSWMKAQARG